MDIIKYTECLPTPDGDVSETTEHSHLTSVRSVSKVNETNTLTNNSSLCNLPEYIPLTLERNASKTTEQKHPTPDIYVGKITEQSALNVYLAINKDRKLACKRTEDFRSKPDRYFDSSLLHKSANNKEMSKKRSRREDINKHKHSCKYDNTDTKFYKRPSKDRTYTHKYSNKRNAESIRHMRKGYHHRSSQVHVHGSSSPHRNISSTNRDSNRPTNEGSLHSLSKTNGHETESSQGSSKHYHRKTSHRPSNHYVGFASKGSYHSSQKARQLESESQDVQRDDHRSKSHRRKDRHNKNRRFDLQTTNKRQCEKPTGIGHVPPKPDLRLTTDDIPNGNKRKLPCEVGDDECNSRSSPNKIMRRSLSEGEIDDDLGMDANERWHKNEDVRKIRNSNNINKDESVQVHDEEDCEESTELSSNRYNEGESCYDDISSEENFDYEQVDGFDDVEHSKVVNDGYTGNEQGSPSDDINHDSRPRIQRNHKETQTSETYPISTNTGASIDQRNAQINDSTYNDAMKVRGPNNSHLMSIQMLRKLKGKEPRDIVMKLVQPDAYLGRIVVDSGGHQDDFTLLLSVFAKAASCTSMNQHLTQVLSLLNNQEFFKIAATFFTCMPPEEAEIFANAMKHMLTIMENMASKVLVPLMQLIGIHGILEGVVQKLEEKSVIVDDNIRRMLKQFTRHKDKIRYNNIRDVPYLGGNQDEEAKRSYDDFRDLDILPHISEIQVQSGKGLRPNKVGGKYEDLEQYLEIQFRLLREDFVWPLREGIYEYTQSLADNVPHRRFQYINIYNNVSVLRSVCIIDKGVCYLIRLDIRHMRKERLTSSKRLIFGSLLCFSLDNFQTFMFATVVDRDNLNKGIVTVRFENRNLNVQSLFQSDFTMVETPSAYFESLRHVLAGLQNIKPGSLPFEKYIISCENNVDVPEYLRRNQHITFDLRPLVDKDAVLQRHIDIMDVDTARSVSANNVAILDLESWPSEHVLQLDKSQLRAIQTALTKEFAIIQGPPGTGKTYIGLKIVKALLHNNRYWAPWYDKRPMLIVCYTNHALDQFLEGVVKFYPDGILRVGTRSNSEVLKNLSLNEARRTYPRSREIYLYRKNVLNDLHSLQRKIGYNSAVIMFAKTTVLKEEFLQPYMGKHFGILLRQAGKSIPHCPTAVSAVDFSAILMLLELDKVLSTNGKNTCQKTRYQSAEKNYIAPEEYADLFRQAVAMDPHAAQTRVGVTDTLRRTTIRRVQNHLQSSDMMTEEEADQVDDLLVLSEDNKWRLYRFWKEKCCESYLKQMNKETCEYEAAVSLLGEIRMQEDRSIMRASTVIGMTTTCAARYQTILKEVGPRIIVVEEAAEVLESHIITSLNEACEHLILIGDHKQLRPKPTVNRLATDFNIDVSLFERLVKNKFRCDCLELQHRMRPEIANLMHHIYTNYRNHEDVTKYDKIKGVSTNLFFINHNAKESHDEDFKNHSNAYEADFIVALCRYLLEQGYKSTQITVLTLYSGQMFALKQRMPMSIFQGVRVAVVDNYQGEENDIILLTLVRSNLSGDIGFLKTDNRVCVALSRAKLGLYVIGNFDLLSQYSNTKLWKALVQDMTKRNLIGDELVLQCQNHPNVNTVVRRKEDFDSVPNGGCNSKCEYRLACGHKCEKHCHVLDQKHETYLCQKVCGKLLCENKHRCQKICYEKCIQSFQCTELVEKRIPRCGHAQQVPCHQMPEEVSCEQECKTVFLYCGHTCSYPCGKEHTLRCDKMVEKNWPCGHTGKVKCCEKEDKECSNTCDIILPCEHPCVGKCSNCSQIRLHHPCDQNCKKILVCGHDCSGICNQCPPCTTKCENRCIHSKCQQRCGEPCTQCKEPCEWRCEHFKCSKLCSEPCDRPRCNEPCKKVLDCKHPCIGLCGEPCPTDCRVCDAQKVKEIVFGDEDEPDSHFVLLEDCLAKCIIESKALDVWMDTAQDGGEEIKLKKCPKCSTTIRKSNRYGSIINKSLQDIEYVKRKILTKKNILSELEQDIKTTLEESSSSTTVVEMKRRLKEMPTPKTETKLIALKNQLEILRRIKQTKMEWKKQHDVSILQEKENMLKFLKQFRGWAITKRAVLTRQELEDAECELLRSKHRLRLYLYEKKIKERKSDVAVKLNEQFREKERILSDVSKKYKGGEREAVESYLNELKKTAPWTGLGIDEDERKMIVATMDLPKGHWFKCPNGHVYAIGDCGGATVESTCPECKTTIGGTDHQLRGDNALAGEMDHAQHAAWSEQANVGNYGFNAQF